MSRVAIVNFAQGAWYPRGQARLEQSLKDFNAPVDFIGIKSHSEMAGCPPHKEVPYAFKTHALMKVVNMKKYEIVIFLDSSIYAIKPIEPLLERIEKEGYYFEEAGHWTGTWCTDASLAKMGLTRDEAMKMPMLSAGFVGLRTDHYDAMSFLGQWHNYAQDGVTFKGPWTNADKKASADPRCQGHRHDMSAASVIANRMGLKLSTCGDFMAYSGPGYGKPKDTVVFLLCAA